MGRAKQQTAINYTIPHTCGHIEKLMVFCKMPKGWLAEEAKKPCPDCREIRR